MALEKEGGVMALLGTAALAMWWDMAAEMRADFEDWHSHEHFPERLGVPGFRRGSRWRSAEGGEAFFVMYELATHEVLSSPAYVERLNAPTPWSTRLMPHHRNMVRCQCHVVASRGGGVAGYALTLRFSPMPGRDKDLKQYFESLVESLANRPGLVGAHLLRHETPAMVATTEQKIRGLADQAADWIFVACGYDAAVLQALARSELGADQLAGQGAAPGLAAGLFQMSYSAVATDVS
jgi:hypothetical protein